MKLKVKFDQKAIQDFLLRTIEKIVLGVVAVVFLWMMYSALSQAGGFGKSPAELQADVRKGENTIKSTPAESDLKVADYAALAKRSRDRIEEAPYQDVTLWDPPLFERRPQREAPLLLAVQQLRGSAGVGAFRAAGGGVIAQRGGRGARPAMARAAAGDALHGKRWVVVTGLVPIERQEAAYAEAFRTAMGYDPQTDYRPNYLGYWIQRVEVAGPSEAANPDWSKATEFISTKATAKAMEEWSPAGEVLNPEYIEQNLVFPLGPLVNRTWDASVAHEPEIPMPKAVDPVQERGGRATGPLTGKGGFVFADKGGRRDAMGADANVDSTPFGSVDATAAERRGAGRADVATAQQPKPSSYKLFRFFDFDVEPGKQYVYRVRLGVQNPNHGQPISNLKTPELAKATFLKTKWSDPTSAIPVPRDTRLFAVSVKPPRGYNEPSGQIMAVSWVHDKGLELYKDFGVIRGQVANYLKETVSGTSVDFISDATIVDMRGGERLPGSRRNTMYASGQILILDPAGNLRLHDELDDAPDRERVISEQTVEEGRGVTPGRTGGKGLEMIDNSGSKGKR